MTNNYTFSGTIDATSMTITGTLSNPAIMSIYNGTAYTELVSSATANTIATLPNQSGTVALLSNIPASTGSNTAIYQYNGVNAGTNQFNTFAGVCSYFAGNPSQGQMFYIVIDVSATTDSNVYVSAGTYTLPANVTIISNILSTSSGNFITNFHTVNVILTGLAQLTLSNITWYATNSTTPCITVNNKNFYMTFQNSFIYQEGTAFWGDFINTSNITWQGYEYSGFANAGCVNVDATTVANFGFYNESQITAGSLVTASWTNTQLFCDCDALIDPSYFPYIQPQGNSNFVNYAAGVPANWTANYGSVPLLVNTALDAIATKPQILTYGGAAIVVPTGSSPGTGLIYFNFPGSGTFNLNKILITFTPSGTGNVYEIYDITNGKVIATSSTSGPSGPLTVNMGTLSNLPAGQALWVLYGYTAGSNGSFYTIELN